MIRADEQPAFRLYLCAGVHCSARGSQALIRAAETQLAAAPRPPQVELRVSSCQNRCDAGPNATVWPGPQRLSELDAAALAALIGRLAER